ncbi:hypothetical protein N7539_007917 [Penicillium diatomitis]|uniref:Mis12-Mtw1 family protein n=1 Tax=Penicillium diatomitis TaxID=2819901 RepID=A0A9X0BNF1_9EURO|nr:uncharacterized protein N7539_007917 [Penicillium diatomitis]KAJ5475630.1 hypothetical protein N7539_007917 [Penicillium diatomitis]
MTIAVVTTSTTKTKRREPLLTLGMAATQAHSRSGGSSGGTSKSGLERRGTQLSANKQGLEKLSHHETKRKADYDDDADGFEFSILPSKKTKPMTAQPASHFARLEADNSTFQPSPRRGRPPKKRPGEGTGENAGSAKGQVTNERPSKRPTRASLRSSDLGSELRSEATTHTHRNRDRVEEPPSETKKKRGRPPKAKPQETNGYHSPAQPPVGVKVSLPTADTPVIQRNKEFRGAKSKGGRRSSLQMRGRRASDLIDSGTSNALPHREVSTADFYKHIADEGLPEPRRMRQLLIWCATRALPHKPSGSHSDDISARLAARAIQEEILKEFSSNSDLSNWFSREEVGPAKVVVKKPNPRNVQNTEKIKELEGQIQKLQRERQALNALLKQPALPRIDLDSPIKSPRKPPGSKQQPTTDIDINISLLDPTQRSLYTTLYTPPTSSSSNSSRPNTTDRTTPQPPMAPAVVSARLSKITTRIAPTLDTLAAGIHDIELYRSTADAVSSRVLRICAQRLEERDARNTQQRLAIEGEESEQGSVDISSGGARGDLGLILGALSRLERR